MEFPELPSVKQKSPTHPFGLKSRKSANLFKRTLSHDQGIKQLRVESTSGSTLSLSPSWLPPPSEPACWDENKATSSASCNVQLSTGHSWPSTSDSAVVGTGKWAFTNGLENYRRCGTELATGTRRRCNSIPPDNKLKITAVQQATGSTVSSSPNEKKKKKKEEGKVEPQIYKPMKTCEGASVTTPPSTEKTDIGYLFICKEDKLMRIPIKLDVDRKEERYMQNISADCGAMKYLKSSKDLRFVSMRKKAMEEIDMDLKDLFENCDWVKVADGSLFKPCGEVAFNDDMRTHKMAENRCVPKVPVSDVSRQPNESSTYPRAEEALDYRTGFLTSQEAETRISTNQSSLKRPFMRMNSTKDATDNQMDQSRLGKSNLQRSPFESVKMCKSTAVPKSKTPPPAHHPSTATGTGGVVFRPAILTVPGLTPARLSSCWTSPANAIFQLETPLDCHRENNNLLLGSAQNFGTVGGPEAAMTAAVAMKPVHQPKLDSQSQASWNGTPPRLCISNRKSPFASSCTQTLQSLPTETAAAADLLTAERPEKRTTALAGNRTEHTFPAFSAYTGHSFSSLARLVCSEPQYATALVANKNSTLLPTAVGFGCKAAEPDVVTCVVRPEHHHCASTWPRTGNCPSGMNHSLPADTASHPNHVLESLKVSQRQITVPPSSETFQGSKNVSSPLRDAPKWANTQTVVTGTANSIFTRLSSNWMTANLPLDFFAHHDSFKPDACVQIRLGEPGVPYFLPQPPLLPIKSCARCSFPAPNVNVLDLHQEVPLDLSQRSTIAGPAFLHNNRPNGSLIEPSTGSNFMASSLRETAASTSQREAGDTVSLSTQQPSVGTELPRALTHECIRCHREPKNCICPRPFAFLPTSGVPSSVSVKPAYCHMHPCPVTLPNPELAPPPSSSSGTKSSRRPQDPRPFECNQCNISYSSRGHLLKHYHSRQHLTKLCGNLQRDELVSCIKPLPPDFIRSLVVDENTGELSSSEIDKIAKLRQEQSTNA